MYTTYMWGAGHANVQCDISTGPTPIGDGSKRCMLHKVMLQNKLISYKIKKSSSHAVMNNILHMCFVLF